MTKNQPLDTKWVLVSSDKGEAIIGVEDMYAKKTDRDLDEYIPRN